MVARQLVGSGPAVHAVHGCAKIARMKLGSFSVLAARLLLASTLTATLAACDREALPSPSALAPLVTVYPEPAANEAGSADGRTPNPTAGLAVAQPTLDALAYYDGQWRLVKPGIERINLRGRVGEADELLVVARLDPSLINLQVRYTPDTPRHVRDWLHGEQVDVVINGGYYDENNVATALTVIDGVSTGSSYQGFGGMFSLRGGVPSLQWLRAEPYQPDPQIEYALQGSPMLVNAGRMVQGISDNGAHSRRSFVAIDAKGRVLLGVCQYAQWTLTELARFLASDESLSVVSALNLDGGGSTGLWMSDTSDATLTDSLDRVPMVIIGRKK